MIHKLQIFPRDIILLGQSLGSAPSIHLAIKDHFQDIKAIILIAPIASGIKLVSPDIKTDELEKIDVFCNIKKITEVSCPIFIVHGMKDEDIPIKQSLELSKFIKHPYEWHPRNGDHTNILTTYRTKFLQKCKFFFEYLNFFNQKTRLNNSNMTYQAGPNDKFYNQFHTNQAETYNPYPSLNVEENLNYNYMSEQMKNGQQAISYQEKLPQFEFYQNQNINNISKNNNNNNNLNSDFNKIIMLKNNKSESKEIYRSSKLDCPFDPKSVNNSFNNTKNISGEFTYDQRDSKEGNVYSFKDNKDLEEQYNQLCRLNGI
jgi:hypothetical protein